MIVQPASPLPSAALSFAQASHRPVAQGMGGPAEAARYDALLRLPGAVLSLREPPRRAAAWYDRG